jgi:hypothetical protein
MPIHNLENPWIHGLPEMVNEIRRGVFEVSLETSVSDGYFMEQQKENICWGKLQTF